jgi:hypothetical protein
MPFFFIVPLWLLFVLCGIVLLFLPRYRRVGLYAINISTMATLTSFLASMAVLYVGPRIGAHLQTRWLGVAVIGAYLFAIGLGALVGGITGFFLTRKLIDRHVPD